MINVIQPFHLLLVALAGWLNHHQQSIIDYLIEKIVFSKINCIVVHHRGMNL